MITLFLGGARSGKSRLAEECAASFDGPVTYIATMVPGTDEDLNERVAIHRLRRPSEWATLECPDDLAEALASTMGTVIVDSLGPWVARRLESTIDEKELCAALVTRRGDTILVSEEVGLGVHPESEVGRRFRDVLGELNQRLAQIADETFLVVAGCNIKLTKSRPE